MDEITKEIEHHYRGYPLSVLDGMKGKPTDEAATAFLKGKLPGNFISAKMFPNEVQAYSDGPLPELE